MKKQTQKQDKNKKKRTILLATLIPVGAAAIATAVTVPLVLNKNNGGDQGTFEWNEGFSKIWFYDSDSCNVTWDITDGSVSKCQLLIDKTQIHFTVPTNGTDKYYEWINGIWMDHAVNEDSGACYYEDIGEGISVPIDTVIYYISQSTPTEKGNNYYKGTAQIPIGESFSLVVSYQLFFSGNEITKITYTCEELPALDATCEFSNYGNTKVDGMTTITVNNLFKGVQTGDNFTADLGNISYISYCSHYCLFDIRNQIKSNYTISFDGLTKSDLTQSGDGVAVYDSYHNKYYAKSEEIKEGFAWNDAGTAITIDKDLIKAGPLLVEINLAPEATSLSNVKVTLAGSN